MVSIWVSLLYLPIHFIHCKEASCLIVAMIGKTLRVDHAIGSINRLSFATGLIENDVS